VNFIKQLINSSWHVVWLILFFILHGYAGYIGLLSITDLLILFTEYCLLAAFVYVLSKRFFKESTNAAIYTTLFMLVFLFFEDLRIFTAKWKWIAPLSALKFYFPLSLVILLIGFYLFRKLKKPLIRLTVFLNIIFGIYLLMEIVDISNKLLATSAKKDKEENAMICDSCAKPSVYLVVMDEYFGSNGLKEYFNYDNSWFENKLRQNGFSVITNTKSNYHYTVFSMASMLNMDYIKDMGEQTVFNQYGYYKATLGIRENEVCKIFANQGYDIVNYSDFDIDGHPAGQGYHLLPSGQALISNRTMYYQVKKNLPNFLARYAAFTGMANELAERAIVINEQRLSKTLEAATPAPQKPSFTYLHLNMPHMPYAFDSTGNKVLAKWFQNLSHQQKDEMYLQYLVYTNKKMAGFIDSLQTKTQGKAVVILMSDHGYREALNKTLALAHDNFFAVYQPSTPGSFHQNSITAVNTFRYLFNNLFNTRFQPLKDSLVIK
jgi:hypothetical protein